MDDMGWIGQEAEEIWTSSDKKGRLNTVGL
jgi:hypothetical protein